jgi:hypothetical protein
MSKKGMRKMTDNRNPRIDLDAPGGLAFFEWAWHECGEKLQPRIIDAVVKLLAADEPVRPEVNSLSFRRRRPALGIWAENDWDTVIDSFRRAGLRVDNPNTRDAIREAVGEWLIYRAKRGLLPDGFEALEDYYLEHLP